MYIDSSSKRKLAISSYFRPVTVNGQTACEKDSDCNGSCGLDPDCYWVCENNLCGYQTRPTFEPISNREAGIPDLPSRK